MLGLGTNIIKGGAGAKTIVTDNLVLKHGYAVNPVQPLSDGAAYFDASGNDAISMGDQDDLSFGTGSFSMLCWVYSTQTGASNFVVSKKAGATVANVGYALYLGNSGTDWIFSASDGTDYAAPSTAVDQNANQWYHVCGTFDGVAKTAKLYVDGVLIATVTDTDIGDIDTTQPFQIGKTGTSTSTDWDGYICNVGTWDAVLSQAQIKSIMNKNYAGLSDSEKTSLVSWWNLDSVIPDTTAVYDNHHGGGEILGSELITCRDFECALPDSDIWLDLDSGATFSDNSVTITRVTGSKRIRQSNITTDDKSYKVTYEITAGDATDLRYYNGSGYVVIPSTIGTHTFNYTRLGTNDAWYFSLYGGTSITINSVSVKLINGNTGTLS